MSTNKRQAYTKKEKLERITDRLDKEKELSNSKFFTNDYHLNNKNIISRDKGDILNAFWRPPSQGRPMLFNTDIELYTDILDYFEKNSKTRRKSEDRKGLIQELKEPLSWLDMCHSLGVSASSLRPYVDGEYDDLDNSFSSLLLWAREVIEADLQKQSLIGTYDPRFAIELLRSKYGWTVENKFTIHQEVSYSSSEATRLLAELLKEAKGYLEDLS